jgi:hypothetical protein
MTKSALVGWAAVAGIGVLVACSSNSSSSSPSFLPFSGPSCPPGAQVAAQPGDPASSACNKCEQSHCSMEAQCLQMVCSVYFTCYCACQMNDYNCRSICSPKLTTDCRMCINTVNQCGMNSCTDACMVGGVDAGPTTEGGTTSD